MGLSKRKRDLMFAAASRAALTRRVQRVVAVDPVENEVCPVREVVIVSFGETLVIELCEQHARRQELRPLALLDLASTPHTFTVHPVRDRKDLDDTAAEIAPEVRLDLEEDTVVRLSIDDVDPGDAETRTGKAAVSDIFQNNRSASAG